jgi:hypothetical protein
MKSTLEGYCEDILESPKNIGVVMQAGKVVKRSVESHSASRVGVVVKEHVVVVWQREMR